jgi:hypothetical protein
VDEDIAVDVETEAAWMGLIIARHPAGTACAPDLRSQHGPAN